MKTHRFLPLLPTIFFLLISLLIVLKSSCIKIFDQFIFGLFSHLHNFALTNFFKIYTQLGNPKIYICFSLMILLVFIWFKHYKITLFLIFNFYIGPILNHIIKHIFQRSRPDHKLISVSGYSFPSGHSVVAMLLFGSFILISYIYLKNKQLKWTIYLISTVLMLLLAASRIYLHVHYPSDVLAGLLLGVICLQITSHYYLRKES